ncbi:M24 family metallopeptidase [Deinococcus aquiradiocola]|uniref:Xaa-Pro aminopeptidase n=1 Tax=Deinococcus aquiradiocola TaxID=393059 RepID=A0A917P9Y5_9DEIO|nr:Xaa-Pro peptidase family protein [Deinococcus aquiradiocola]GGJ68125.1 Xaa-Pro aminopeptidase [Deinococcus aquiradiocola]
MTQPDARLEITPDEYRQRRERLCLLLQAQGLDAVCVFAPVRVAYLSGFFFSATERPIALIVTASGEVAALLPRLEVSHYELQGPGGTLLEVYAEYPGGGSGRHPMRHLQDLLTRLGLQDRRVAADVDGYEHRWGYRGPALSEVLGRPVPSALALIDDLRAVKSSAEIALMREACRWGDHAHRLMQDGLHVGAQELLVSHAASLQATEDLLGTLGGRYVPKSREGMPANAMFIRGANTAHPHGLHQAGPVQRGDVLVTGAYGIIGGYESELERTMIVGDPGPDVARYFGAMLTAQQVAFGALRPGRTCAEVEADVRRFIRDELGMDGLVRHHTGHAFGLEGHEHPFLDLDDHSVIVPGMVFSVEPGLYVPDVAGFRHSDTVVVTATGNERLSLYPRDLASLTVPVPG